jgi:hypothetical protein
LGGLQATDLERTRNNQRRARARRKDYIAELEQKIRAYEDADSQVLADAKFQKVMEENECLKRLLQSLGLESDFLQAYLRAGIQARQLPDASTYGEKKCCKPEEHCFVANSSRVGVPFHAYLRYPI